MTDAPQLKLFNSLNRQLEPFVPVHEGEARVYTCGPTVYNYPHIGNMRAYVFADVLGRTLSWTGHKLTHIINITDVGHLTDDGDAGEDKLEKMAATQKQSIWDIAEHYTKAFKDDINALNIRQPAQWSVATDYIEEMIDFAKKIEAKHCYQLESGLYFDVSTVEDYGRLARAVTEEGEGRIDTVEGKRNAADFAIWRTTPEGETRQMEWDSPWGRGAPGWHLECSVMGGKLLGFPFDIHTGGIDHREIHHPNEIAQNQAYCGCGGLDDAAHSGAKIWMHNNFLVERSGKMSKSSGEFLRLQLLIDKGYHPLAYRMMCLQAHYRSELEFSWEGLGAALTRLKRMVIGVEKLRGVAMLPEDKGPDLAGLSGLISNDLNTPEVLTLLEDWLKRDFVHEGHRWEAVQEVDKILGLKLDTLTREDLRIRPKDAVITEDEIEQALADRKAARAEKDFATSDAIRDELTAKGVEVMDGDPLGWEWKLA
ncbi:cysteine--tRNA ligase [Alteriqipengyuania lutimaris]|uniref:Cysteine--tRNA ligase n=1 Tax=Alteriqipengyuania lutimaris TaxID=1538146 RepID=A0A395LGQ0_9SPHN|nr:cysteine--tRNA ligase [Alteriqipengyuania lutimaris]MBB3035506.1 cysteinyl-tRNA synthetase [Alteriqipengyuania lutimaris]RDS76066.1 cysteine--tRNA ligase [Alteriqipengyuania lutimaris]